MPYPYYNRLPARDKRTYDQSDRISRVRLPSAWLMQPLVLDLERALQEEQQAQVRVAAQRLLDALTQALGAPAVRVKVLARRPDDDWGELHGLYEGMERRQRACITVWMRTAKRKQVVAFKTFLRTLLHELCHHLDYEVLKLPESFHTEGFFKRESSLYTQLMDTKQP